MSEIRIITGSCGVGIAAYADGAFRMPDGDIRGVEALDGLTVEGDPARWSGDLLRGLHGALAATGPLPRPLGLAASMLGFGLDAVGRATRTDVTLRAVFRDGATAEIRTGPETAALIVRDRAVVQSAAARLAIAAEARPVTAQIEHAPPARLLAPPARVIEPEPEPDLTSMFEYEKRNGRLRRLARGKAPTAG